MDPNKAPGFDGLNPAFFQKHWNVVSPDIWSAFSLWLMQGNLPWAVSSTLLVFILKCENSLNVKDFRPMVLCYVVYKILSKVLANILECVLGKIISPNHSAFISKRLITDNFIATFEIIHGLK